MHPFVHTSATLMRVALITAISSAFTMKFVNPTGYVAGPHGTLISAETDHPNCRVQACGTLCSIRIAAVPIEPVYATPSDAQREKTPGNFLKYQ